MPQETKKVPMPEFSDVAGNKLNGTRSSYDSTGREYPGSPGAIKDAEPYKDKPDYACYLAEIFVNKYLGYIPNFNKWLDSSGCTGEVRKKLDAVKYGSTRGKPEEVRDTITKREKKAKEERSKKRRSKLKAQLDG